MRLLPNAEHSTIISGLSAPHFAFSFRQFVLATLKGYPLPEVKAILYQITSLQFSWNRWDDPISKKGGIELISNTPVKQIYGWVGDTRSDFRRDFRLAGVRNNHKGNFLKPDYPDLPEGYPDKFTGDAFNPNQNYASPNMTLKLVRSFELVPQLG